MFFVRLPLFFVITLSSISLACPLFYKIALDPLLLEKLPGLRVGSGSKEIPYLKDYLSPKSKDWYSLSIELPPKGVDPLYSRLANSMGEPVILGGGSDLIEVALLQTAKLASKSEINVLMKKEYFEPSLNISMFWRQISLNVPEFQGRPAVKNVSFSINGESGVDLIYMVRNVENGHPIIQDYFPLAVPFKHGHIAVVWGNGAARLYFRTPKDAENYAKKILTLADEDTFPKDWLTDPINLRSLAPTLKYHLNVYSRAKPLGWHYSDISWKILQSWVSEIKRNKKELDHLKKSFYQDAINQGVDSQYADLIWKEFGLE